MLRIAVQSFLGSRARGIAAAVVVTCAVYLSSPTFGQTAPWQVNGSNWYTPSGTQAAIGSGGSNTAYGFDLYVNAPQPKVLIDATNWNNPAAMWIQGRSPQGSAISHRLAVDGSGLFTVIPTTGVVAFSISQSGNVGIGTASSAPWAALDVNSTGSKALHVLDTAAGGVLIGYQGASIQGRTSGDANGNLYLNNFGGNVGIGTTAPQHLLHVAGTIGAIEVIVSGTGADYVFNPNYRLKPLTEVASFIKEHHHLPEIPSEAEVKEKGVSVGDMQAKLLAKIEELTLHMIQADERNTGLEQRNRELQERIARLEARGMQPNH
jgi:hypothetical protein